MIKNQALLLLFLVFYTPLIQSCKFLQKKNDDKNLLAIAYDEKLFFEDIKNNIPSYNSKSDSILFINNYINKWIKRQTLYHNANLNLQEEKNIVDKKILEYKQDFMIYMYREKFIINKIDTVFKQEEIEKIYEENKDNFILTDPVYKIIIIELEKTNSNNDEIISWIKNYTPENHERLKNFINNMHSKYYNIDENKWIFQSELIINFHINYEEFEKMGLKYNVVQLKEIGNKIVVMKILNKLAENQLAPLSVVENRIKSIILNTKKKELLFYMEKELINIAKKENQVQVYFEEL